MSSPKRLLVERNLDLARYIANSFHRRWRYHFEFDELLSFGVIGLIQAARRYNPKSGTTFSTFAYQRIRGAITDGINDFFAVVPEEVELALQYECEATGLDDDMEGAVDHGGRALALTMIIRDLPSKVRDLLLAYYVAGENLRGAGRTIGVSKSRASRMHAQALSILRNRMENHRSLLDSSLNATASVGRARLELRPRIVATRHH